MHKRMTITLALILALSFTACAAQAPASLPQSTSTSTSTGTSTGQSAPSSEVPSASDGLFSTFSTTDLAGNAVDQTVLAEHNVTMINVWATFCSPCLSEMPDLGALHQDYADKGVQVIGLVTDVISNQKGDLVDSQVALAQQLAQDTGADYLHLLPSEGLLNGVLRDVSAVPTTFFVDAQGNLLTQPYLGARSGEEWRKIIDALLETVQ